MTSAIKFCVIFLIFLIKNGQANTAAEQMRSWYDFLSSLGTKDLTFNPDSAHGSPFGNQQTNDELDVPRTGQYEQEPDDVLTPDSYCSKETASRLKYYCKGLHDGDYFDPWNPYCGFIRCAGQVPQRLICNRGTWMGSDYGASKGQYFMCRRSLAELKMQIIEDDYCPMKTDLLVLCETAHKVSGMNALVRVTQATGGVEEEEVEEEDFEP